MIITNIWENKKCSKPPTRLGTPQLGDCRKGQLRPGFLGYPALRHSGNGWNRPGYLTKHFRFSSQSEGQFWRQNLYVKQVMIELILTEKPLV